MKRDPLAIKQNGNKEGERGIKKERRERERLAKRKIEFLFLFAVTIFATF